MYRYQLEKKAANIVFAAHVDVANWLKRNSLFLLPTDATLSRLSVCRACRHVLPASRPASERPEPAQSSATTVTQPSLRFRRNGSSRSRSPGRLPAAADNPGHRRVAD